MPFGVDFQRAVIRLAMLDDAFCSRVVDYLDVGHFGTEPLGWAFKCIRDYWESYARACSPIVLRDYLRHVPDDQRRQVYSEEVEAVIHLHSLPEDYVRTELREFCRRQVFAVAHRESAALFNEGKTDEAYDHMARAQDRIHQIQFEDLDRQWFFEEFNERHRRRQQDRLNPRHEAFLTGLGPLDDITGGVQKGEVWAVFAYAKRCKTTWLINQGYSSAFVAEAPTLHFVLEGKGSQTAARYDALCSRELYSMIKDGRMSPQAYHQTQIEYARKRGLLVIRTLNDWDVNVGHLQAELTELRARAFKPEMVILDYMDLLRSRGRADSETQHQINAARDFKRLTIQNDFASWTAWQAQRPRDGANAREHILTSANVADAYAKVRIVDAYGSLNATDDEMSRGEMRVFMEGHRDSPINQVYRIKNDLSRMLMVTSWSVGEDDMPAGPAPDNIGVPRQFGAV